MSRPSSNAHINVLRSADFLKIVFFKNILQEHFQIVKWFGPRMSVLIWVLFAYQKGWSTLHNLSDKTGLGPSTKGIVTDGNAKFCRWDIVLVLFQSTSAYKIDSDYIRDHMKLISVFG